MRGGSRAIRQAEVGAAKTMIERTEQRWAGENRTFELPEILMLTAATLCVVVSVYLLGG
jgi:hypothetical protein